MSSDTLAPPTPEPLGPEERRALAAALGEWDAATTRATAIVQAMTIPATLSDQARLAAAQAHAALVYSGAGLGLSNRLLLGG